MSNNYTKINKIKMSNNSTKENEIKHLDDINNILHCIKELLERKKYIKSFWGHFTQYPDTIKKIIHDFETPRFTNMETTLKLLISSMAYINDINFTDSDLEEVYELLTYKGTNRHNKIKECGLQSNGHIEILKKLELIETDPNMQYLISLMSNIDAIIARGKTEGITQLGLKGSAFTAGNVKKHTKIGDTVGYLFGVYGFLLGRFFTDNNIEKGKLIINSLPKDKKSIEKYLKNKSNINEKLTKQGTNYTHKNINNLIKEDDNSLNKFIKDILTDIEEIIKSDKYKSSISKITFGFGTQLPDYTKKIIDAKTKKFTDSEITIKLLISSMAYINDISLTDNQLNEIYTEINKEHGNNDEMNYLIMLMGHIDAIMGYGKDKSGFTGHAYTRGNVIKLNKNKIPIQYLFGIYGFLLGRYFTKKNIKKGKNIIEKLFENTIIDKNLTNIKNSKNYLRKYLGNPDYRKKFNNIIIESVTKKPVNNASTKNTTNAKNATNAKLK